MSGNFDLIIDDFSTYLASSPTGAEGHTLRYSFFTLVNTAAIIGTTFWAGCHHYFVKMVQHLSYPTFMCYSISYNEEKDEMVMILADSDKWKMWSPRRLFVTVKEASKIDFEPGLDNVDQGIGGRIKVSDPNLFFSNFLRLRICPQSFKSTVNFESFAILAA